MGIIPGITVLWLVSYRYSQISSHARQIFNVYKELSIHILIIDCKDSFQNLLHSLNTSNYGQDMVDLTIHINLQNCNSAKKEELLNLKWTYGKKKIITHNNQMDTTWKWFQNTAMDKSFVVFEANVALVPDWYVRLKLAWNTYGIFTNFAGIGNGINNFKIMKSNERNDIKQSYQPTVLSPNPYQWQLFIKWLGIRNIVTFNHSTDTWSETFFQFCCNQNLYLLHTEPSMKELLSTLMVKTSNYRKINEDSLSVVINPGMKMSQFRSMNGSGEISCETRRYGSTLHGCYLPTRLKEMLPANSVIYVIRSSEDLSFEIDLTTDTGALVHIFESSSYRRHKIQKKEKISHGLETKLRFHSWGITAEDEDDLKFYSPNASIFVSLVPEQHSDPFQLSELRTIETTLQLLGHNYVDLLKINGLEVDILKYMLKYKIFPKLVVTTSEIEKFNDVMDTLKTMGYKVIPYVRNEIHRTFIHDGCMVDPFVQKAKQISLRHGFVNVQVFNRGFLEISKSWICNVRSLKNVLSATLFVVTDSESYTALAQLENVNVVLIEFKSPKDMIYGEETYYSFTHFRTDLILKLLKSDINVWSTESDATWFASPWNDMDDTSDLLLVDNRPERKRHEVSVGMIYLKATTDVISLWENLLNWRRTNPNQEEQNYLSQLVRETKASVRWLSSLEYVSGLWYLDITLRTGLCKGWEKVIQNNFIIGNDKKIKRAQKFGHWFLKSDGSCK